MNVSSTTRNRTPLLVLLIGLTLLAVGCRRDEDIESHYGKASGLKGGSSVNGTAVLADMFEQQGHTVISRRNLTPTVYESADTIVWIPNDHEPPSQEVISWLDDWLWDSPDRKLIFIGRDYDAAITYWEKVLPGAPLAQQAEMRRRLNEAKFDASSLRGTAGTDCEWFEIDTTQPRLPVKSLTGPWADGIDPTKIEIVIDHRMNVDSDWLEEELLGSGEEMIAGRYRQDRWGRRSDAIFIVNGSFLLNLPLVNHEHRKLAGKLISDVNKPGTVVFLESGPGGPPVLAKDPDTRMPSGLGQFTIWPQSIVLLHLAAAGIIFCFARWPIFGRAKKPPRSQAGDFGQHVAAVGELLESTQDYNYAIQRHQQYLRSMHNESSFGPARE